MNLTFHGIGRPAGPVGKDEAAVWVTRERFLEMLDVLAPRDDVRITFDDGNASDIEQAVPALQRHGLTATFFVVAGRLGRRGYLGAGDVRALIDAGMQAGCHGLRHRPWRGLGDAELHEEVVGARRSLEEAIGAPVTRAACPFGAYDRRVLRALRRGGYRRVYTSDGGPARPDAWLQARTTVGAGHDAGALSRMLERGPSVDGAVVARVKRTVKRWR